MISFLAITEINAGQSVMGAMLQVGKALGGVPEEIGLFDEWAAGSRHSIGSRSGWLRSEQAVRLLGRLTGTPPRGSKRLRNEPLAGRNETEGCDWRLGLQCLSQEIRTSYFQTVIILNLKVSPIRRYAIINCATRRIRSGILFFSSIFSLSRWDYTPLRTLISVL